MLEKISDDVWVANYDLFTFGIHFPGRMTVVRLSSGGLWLHSPIPIDDALAEELAALGPVEHLVGPNLFHHVHLSGVCKRYPEAKLWAAPGLELKRKGLEFDGVLGDDPPEAWGGDISQVNLRFVPKIGEVIFFHDKSATLITTDLFMNIYECKGVMSKLVYWLEGGYKRMGVPRLFSLFMKDKAAAAAAAARIIAMHPSTVIMSHGRIVHDQAGNEVARALGVWSPARALASTT